MFSYVPLSYFIYIIYLFFGFANINFDFKAALMNIKMIYFALVFYNLILYNTDFHLAVRELIFKNPFKNYSVYFNE